MRKVQRLIEAGSKGDIGIVEKLLASRFLGLVRGADVNARGDGGWTVLISASSNGHSDLAEFLLGKGADLHVQNNEGNTALILAATNGHKEIVETLLAKGADLNVKNNYGSTALTWASSKEGNREIVDCLLAKGADMKVQNNKGSTALILAAHWGHREIVETLLNKGADMNVKTNLGDTALIAAAGKGHKEIVETLLTKGADDRFRNNENKTALEVADQKGYQQILNMIRSKMQAGEMFTQAMGGLNSQDFHSAVEKAKRARDQAARDEWVQKGCPGAGQSHHCKMCGKTIYGEKTVIEMQKRAIYGGAGGPSAARQWEKDSGYRCKGCGSEYCKDCLERKAPSNAYGGKSCPSCYDLFEIIHG